MILFYFFVFLFFLLCLLSCLIILVQESKSLGLGASFGGDVSNSLFGTGTAQVLKKFTAYLAGIFMISCWLLSIWSSILGRSKGEGSLPQTVIEESVEES